MHFFNGRLDFKFGFLYMAYLAPINLITSYQTKN